MVSQIVTGVSEKKTYIQKINTKNIYIWWHSGRMFFTNLMNTKNPTNQESQWTPNKINKKKTTPRHIIVKLLKTSEREVLKNGIIIMIYEINRIKIIIISHFLSERMQTGEYETASLKTWIKKNKSTYYSISRKKYPSKMKGMGKSL